MPLWHVLVLNLISGVWYPQANQTVTSIRNVFGTIIGSQEPDRCCVVDRFKLCTVFEFMHIPVICFQHCMINSKIFQFVCLFRALLRVSTVLQVCGHWQPPRCMDIWGCRPQQRHCNSLRGTSLSFWNGARKKLPRNERGAWKYPGHLSTGHWKEI